MDPRLFARTRVAVSQCLGLCLMVSLILIGGAWADGNAWGQQLNQRQHAPPDAAAKKARVLTEVRSKSAQQGDASLNRETVNTDCGPIEIGNQPQEDNRPRDRDEQVVVVPGDVINICR